MKLKLYAATIVLFAGVMVYGLCVKAGHKDLNGRDSSLDDYYVALLSDDLLTMTLENMNNTIDDSNYILEVVCTGEPVYKCSCAAQRAEVKKVFKGEDINVGDTIDILKISYIFTTVRPVPSFNISFANLMTPGERYLVFLDRKIETNDEWNLYEKRDDYVFSPIFSYEEHKQGFHEPEDAGTDPTVIRSTDVRYSVVKDEEFFLMSREAVDKMKAFKEDLLLRYPQ